MVINGTDSDFYMEKNYNESIKNTFVISNCYFEVNPMLLEINIDYGTLENTYLYCQKGYTDTLTLKFSIYFNNIINFYNLQLDSFYHISLIFEIK